MNKDIEIEITKLKLEIMDSSSIFKWLEENKEDYKHIAKNKEIVSMLYSRNDKLINMGLALYSRGYTYDMYLNTKNHKEKLAYLSTEVNYFYFGGDEDLISEFINEYNEHKLLKNQSRVFETEEKLEALFGNPNICDLRCILMDLYGKPYEDECSYKYKRGENVFKNIDDELWLKLISYTTNQNILFEYDKTIERDEEFAPAKCTDYINTFWNLFAFVDTTEKNAKILCHMVKKNDAIRNNHNVCFDLSVINRWQSDNKGGSFYQVRYYLAKTNENVLSDLLSSESDDPAIRCAYYSSHKFLKDLNKNLPDENRFKYDGYRYREEKYNYYKGRFEEFYEKDGGSFLDEVIKNESIFLDNIRLEHALQSISKDIEDDVMLRWKIEEMDKKYPNRYKEDDELTEVDKLKTELEKKQYVLEKVQNIDSKTTENFKILNKISFVPEELLHHVNNIGIVLMVMVVLEIVNLFF